ncbi:aminodeoxychorismate synthase component I [Noviherbaspirillum galbum]|uniref:Aminodeoxychorismate synthase component I n=1 Tax=Noviherbaspirillum galbum TaxID=2709383 RepID=A0A6B3SSE7_9BURK|nr:aminodeoxychorismate synthase component I [Noviherbaspirillum galbum]NEX61372.1 aminodeoxychorismate synthase component I [Noviherbaspirillum galbum]
MTGSTTAQACFALLDDCAASIGDRRSRLYTECESVLACHDIAGWPGLLARMQDGLARGLHAVALFHYELGAAMHGIAPYPDQGELARILLFRRMETLSSMQVLAWLSSQDRERDAAGVAALAANVDEAAFGAAVERIRQYIEAGDTYQVNYTMRLRLDAYGSPVALYRRLRQRQPVPYGALVQLPEGGAILSLSPELFVRHEEGRIMTRPMKGTAPAGGDPRADAAQARALAADPKNCAENLMIVDLLRNDLGRVAVTGSVSVPELFQVERFGGVLQMSSTVQAALPDDAGLQHVLEAIYPCGSITGAPKRRTMQIIRELEPEPRGLYTGAIGWFDAPAAGRATGNFCLSVPIRTLVLQAPAGGVRRGELGVGAGIVHDSVAADEFAECQLKARFLTGLVPPFELIETMRAEAGGCTHLDRHLQRLGASARYFGFRFDEAGLRARIDAACRDMPHGVPHRLRLALAHDGSATVQGGILQPLPEPVKLILADAPTRSGDLFLRHKTTLRDRYDAGWRAAEARGGFDMLFFNERGELTEGGRSNVFLKLDGGWVTPPLSAGVLPGMMRGVLLDDPAWNALERTVTVEDLRRAEEVVVCNALRGVLRAAVGF